MLISQWKENTSVEKRGLGNLYDFVIHVWLSNYLQNWKGIELGDSTVLGLQDCVFNFFSATMVHS